MSIGRQALEALHLPITMKTNSTVNTSQADGEQVVRAKKYQVIKLGIDWHAEHYRVVRMIDGAGPEPAQRFSPEDFLAWAQKQTVLAEKVFSCYEAGAGGFVLPFAVLPAARPGKGALRQTPCRRWRLSLQKSHSRWPSS